MEISFSGINRVLTSDLHYRKKIDNKIEANEIYKSGFVCLCPEEVAKKANSAIIPELKTLFAEVNSVLNQVLEDKYELTGQLLKMDSDKSFWTNNAALISDNPYNAYTMFCTSKVMPEVMKKK